MNLSLIAYDSIVIIIIAQLWLLSLSLWLLQESTIKNVIVMMLWSFVFLCYDYYYSFLVWLCYDYYNLFFRMIML